MLFSCNTEEKKYYNEFKKYMKAIHQIDLKNYDGYIYAIHLQGCTDCIYRSYKLLNSIPSSCKSQFKVLMVGKCTEIETSLIGNLKKQYNTIEDNIQQIFSYQTNFAYPIFVKIENGKCTRYQEVTFDDYSEIEEYFNNTYEK